jgi:hypothetical protein
VAIQKQTALLKIQQSAVTNLIAASNQSVADRYAVGTSQRSARAARIIDVDQSVSVKFAMSSLYLLTIGSYVQLVDP